ncbi:MAG: RluA family pseudouridine synthase [Candidatus Zixiibacteriota bacterium]
MNNNRHIEIEVSADQAGERLDKFIGNEESYKISRSQIQKLIDSGHVLVNGKPIKHNYKLGVGDKVTIEIPAPDQNDIAAENIPLEIVFEDEYLIVVNKPAGMVTHPAAGHYTGTLVNALMYYTRNLSTIGGVERLGIVHRLDKNTSGLIMVAKNDEVHNILQTALKDREIEKKYVALVCGHMREDEGAIELPIGRSMKDRKKMVVTNIKSREAVTEYKLIDRFKLYDLLEINLKTGRTHQIRVHFSHRGHPVFGDPDYGGRSKWHQGVISYDKQLAKKSLELFDRQALHARSLKLIHPITGEELFVDSDLPSDFAGLVEFLETEGR